MFQTLMVVPKHRQSGAKGQPLYPFGSI
jgi:hypothetical protein